MADDNTIIEGTVKFRDGKKWKSRWCVMRKLSPVADCVHLQLYRDSKARCAGAGSKASLSLQHYLGCESGFTLDKHSNTLALVCRDLVVVLAFDTRERLIQWQVKVAGELGEARAWLVLVAAGGASPAGPARLLLRGRRLALTAAVPPRLLGVWDLTHLRRYGVVEGRFCFEGGSYCGKGEGLHVLITDQAKEIAHDFDLASQGRLTPKRRALNRKPEGSDSPRSHKAYRPDTRLSDLNTVDQSLSPLDLRLYEEPCAGEEAGAISPYWPSMEARDFHDMGHGDTASVNETIEGTDMVPWNAGNVSIERCMSCISKLGALSRSSTAALTPGAKHFSPAWTMEAVEESFPEPCQGMPRTDPSPSVTDKTDEGSGCSERPSRPPKPTRLELPQPCSPAAAPPPPCSADCGDNHRNTRAGPYENYDVPKLASLEVDGEYYDTPKRLKECLNNELFRMTKSATLDSVILKKPCGCLLKLGKRRKEPKVIDTDEYVQPASCPCRRITDWANGWIGLPYCGKNTVSSDNLAPNKENVKPQPENYNALYATIDISRKTRRKTHPVDADVPAGDSDPREFEIDEGPLANYENLNFALSLEYYENAKDLLRRAGVTQAELDAISANLRPARAESARGPPAADYLAMLPAARRAPPAAYTPMSPPAPAPPPRAASAGPGGACRCARPGAVAGARDSSSSNDSGVSSCSRRRGAAQFELPATTAAARRHYRRAAAVARAGPAPRRSRSAGPPPPPPPAASGPKSSSAEAEVPLLSGKPLRGVMDAHSTSSDTSDMSDYIETLSICSSHSSSDAPVTLRATSTLRPRSGGEYRVAPRRRPPEPPRAAEPLPEIISSE